MCMFRNSSLSSFALLFLLSNLIMLRACHDFLSHATAPLRPTPVHCAPAAAGADVAVAADAADDDDEGSIVGSDPAPESFTLYQVLGWPECPWFHRAACIASDLSVSRPKSEAHQVEVSILPSDRDTFGRQLAQLSEMLPEASGHNSCPAVVATKCHRRPDSGNTEASAEYDCDEPAFVGGYAQLEKQLRERYAFTSVKCDFMARATGAGAGACPVPPQINK